MAVADSEVSGLDGHDGADVREVEQGDQAWFTWGRGLVGAGFDEPDLAPWWEAELTRVGAAYGTVVGLGAKFAHAVFTDDVGCGDTEVVGDEVMESGLGELAGAAFVASGFHDAGVWREGEVGLGGGEVVKEFDEAEGRAGDEAGFSSTALMVEYCGDYSRPELPEVVFVDESKIPGTGGSAPLDYGLHHGCERGVRGFLLARHEVDESDLIAVGEQVALKPGQDELLVVSEGGMGMVVFAGFGAGGAAGAEHVMLFAGWEAGELELLES